MFFKWANKEQPLLDAIPVPGEWVRAMARVPSQIRPLRLQVKTLGTGHLTFANSTEERPIKEGDRLELEITFHLGGALTPFFTPILVKGTVGRTAVIRQGTLLEGEVRFDKLKPTDKDKLQRFLHRVIETARFSRG